MIKSKISGEPSHRLCLSTFPAEIILHILSYLPGHEFFKCRQVCSRWKAVIDGTQDCNDFWNKYIIRDFDSISHYARKKVKKDMSNFKLYRTLSSWSIVGKATLNKVNFYLGPLDCPEILGIQLLSYGLVGVHTKNAIFYYDLFDLDVKTCRPGQYLSYTEDDNYIVLEDFTKTLYVVRKLISPHIDEEIRMSNIHKYILIDHKIYYSIYSDYEESVFVCDLQEPGGKIKRVAKCSCSIVSMGSVEGVLHFITTARYLYALEDDNLILVVRLSAELNNLFVLCYFDLVENMEWPMFYVWMHSFRYKIRKGLLREIVCMKVYGDVVFLGCKWGILRMYYAPYKNHNNDLFSIHSFRQFKLIEREYNCPRISLCPVINIDVMESDNGHIVVAAMPMKMVLLKFTHNFKAASRKSKPRRTKHYNEMPTKHKHRA